MSHSDEQTPGQPKSAPSVAVHFLRFAPSQLGLTLGLALGAGLCLLTLILVFRGGHPVGPHLALLGQVFIGYRVTMLGSLVGLLYGFVTGYLVGVSIGFTYNFLVGLEEKRATMSEYVPGRNKPR